MQCATRTLVSDIYDTLLRHSRVLCAFIESIRASSVVGWSVENVRMFSFHLSIHSFLFIPSQSYKMFVRSKRIKERKSESLERFKMKMSRELNLFIEKFMTSYAVVVGLACFFGIARITHEDMNVGWNNCELC